MKIILESGNIIYKNKDGEFHRDDGPAIEYENGDKIWYRYDKRHRDDGPAVEYINGYESWWLDGKEYSKSEWENENNT